MAEQGTPEPFDLDALDAEENADTFAVTAGGQVFHLRDPRDLHWRDLAAAQRDPEAFVDAAVTEADREMFESIRIPMRKLEPLMSAYFRHFRLDPGKPNGSPRSSKGTAKRSK